MTENRKDHPHFTEAAAAEAARRRERQAAALRANLARRKAQTRQRAELPVEAPGAAPPAASGEDC